MTYYWLKWIHVLGMVVYVGGLMTLTRVLARAVRYENPASREDAFRTYRRMHVFVDWGGLFLMLGAGLVLLIQDPFGKEYLKQGYFHVKLTCFVVLLVVDVLLSRRLFRMRGDEPQPGPTLFRVLHGVAGLALMGGLFAVYVLRA